MTISGVEVTISGVEVTTVDREMFTVKKFSPIEQMVKIKHAKYFLRRIFRARKYFLQRIIRTVMRTHV